MSSKVMACALCGQMRPIRDSHIIPDFCYKSLYQGDRHRFMVLTTPDARDHRPYLQSGLHAPMLCDECEGKFNDWYEKPFRRMWFEKSFIPNPVPEHGICHVPDWDAFKLFHHSVLWRAGVAARRNANNGFWKGVYLSDRHEAKLRELLLNRDPGPDSLYPVVGWPLVDPSDPGRMVVDIIVPPIETKVGKMHATWFIYAGCCWLYVHSSHYESSQGWMHLRSDGSMMIARWPYDEVDHLVSVAAKGIAREGEKRRAGP